MKTTCTRFMVVGMELSTGGALAKRDFSVEALQALLPYFLAENFHNDQSFKCRILTKFFTESD